jgi:hypothetical protein
MPQFNIGCHETETIGVLSAVKQKARFASGLFEGMLRAAAFNVRLVFCQPPPRAEAQP